MDKNVVGKKNFAAGPTINWAQRFSISDNKIIIIIIIIIMALQ